MTDEIGFLLFCSIINPTLMQKGCATGLCTFEDNRKSAALRAAGNH